MLWGRVLAVRIAWHMDIAGMAGHLQVGVRALQKEVDHELKRFVEQVGLGLWQVWWALGWNAGRGRCG